MRLVSVAGRDGPIGKATLTAISNTKKGSGDNRGEEATAIVWRVAPRTTTEVAGITGTTESIKFKDLTMMMNNTLAQLRELKLAGMATAVGDQLSSSASAALSFGERLALMVDREVHQRADKRHAALLKRARLKYPQACIEDVDGRAGRGLERPALTPGLDAGGNAFASSAIASTRRQRMPMGSAVCTTRRAASSNIERPRPWAW